MSFTQTLKGETEHETADPSAQKPYITTLLTPKQIHFSGLVWLLRAVLVLCDGAHTAEDMAKELFRSFDEVANALFVLYWGGVIQLLVIEDLPTPISGDFAYRFAPLPLAIKLCGGGTYVRPDSDRTAEPAPHTGFRPYQPGTSAGGGPVRNGAPRSLFAA